MPDEKYAAADTFDFVTYDRCLAEGRCEYLQGGGDNPYLRETREWEWWREGYDP